jgi:hypothetical protein
MKHKRQHIVPHCYLSAWLEPNPPAGQQRALWRFSKDGSDKRRRSPKKTFVASDRYTVLLKTGERDLRVEHRLDQIENEFAQVRRRILRGEKIMTLDKAKLAIFAAAMLGRTRRRADHWKRSWESLRGGAVPDADDSAESCTSPRNPSDETLPPGTVRVSKQMLDDMLVNIHPQFLVDMIKTSAPILFQMEMLLCSTADELGFLTSDEPCVMQNPTAYRYHPIMRSAGLLQRDVEVLLPLSPQRLLVFSHTPSYPVNYSLTREQTTRVNRLLVHYALEEIISWKGELRDGWFAPEGPPPEDAYQEKTAGDGDDFESLEKPELIDVSGLPMSHPFRRAMMS